jgi:hypothetical protein
MLPTSLDEPALQEALKNIILKLLFGILAASGLQIADKPTAAITAITAAIVAAGLAYAQGWATRRKVWAPANIPTDALPLEPADGEDVPVSR